MVEEFVHKTTPPSIQPPSPPMKKESSSQSWKERGQFDVISGWGSRGLEGLGQGHQLVLETTQIP